MRDCNLLFLRTHLLMKPLSRCTQCNTLFASDKYCRIGNVSARDTCTRFFRICFTVARFNYCVCFCFIEYKYNLQPRTFYSLIEYILYTSVAHFMRPIALEKNKLYSSQLLFAKLAIASFLDIIIDISFFK